MGYVLSKLWNTLFSGGERKLLILGLDNAGKSTIVYHLVCGRVIETVPTVGGNVEHYKHQNVNFIMWDVGGQDALRQSWNVYFQSTEVLMYVIDSTDKDRLHITKSELWSLLANEQLRGCHLIVMANKQDQKNAMTVTELSIELNLTALRGDNVKSWTIQPCSALTGEGLNTAMEWICKQLMGVSNNNHFTSGKVVNGV